MYKTRYYRGEGTTISLEQSFWDVIDELSRKGGIRWDDWVSNMLISKPERVGRATWLRRQTVSTLRNAAAI